MGYLGMVAGPDLCSEGSLQPVLFATPTVMRVISFQDSPYGLAMDFRSLPTLTPYLIDGATLDVTAGAPITGPYAGSAGDIQAPMVFTDSTMVFGRVAFPGSTSSLYAITRSGLSIAVSGAQQSVTTATGFHVLCRLDSSHFIRMYNPVPNLGYRYEVFSVSGSTISLVHTELISGAQVATVDPSGLSSTMSNGVFPFHYDGAGTLYAFGSATPGSGTLFGPAILAIPFSFAGGFGGAFTLSTRAKDAQNVSNFINPAGGAKIGSSECTLRSVTGYTMGFYDDGTHMHFDATGTSNIWISYENINHADNVADTHTTQGNYLTGNVEELPQGNVVNSGPALVTQSGQTFGYTLITPQFLCPQYGTDIRAGASGGSARHGSNLGAQIIQSPFSAGQFLLRAFKW